MVNGRARAAAILTGTLAVTGIHFATPAGPHSWHLLHLVGQKLYFVPILLAASWFGRTGTIATVSFVSALFSVHVLRDWAGDAMLQADQFAEIGNYWIVAALAHLLFERQRQALVEVQRAHDETLLALDASLELREHYTAGHSSRVRDYSLLLASKLGVTNPDELATIGIGALLHDIGKIGIPDAILLKPAALSEAETATMRTHSELGAKLVGGVRSLAGARSLVLSHHERFDGAGYPHGLAGDAIPLGARIFAVADTLDALTTNRPYRQARSFDEARRVVAEGRATQFDPDVVTACLSTPFGAWAEIARRNGVMLVETGGRVTSVPGAS